MKKNRIKYIFILLLIVAIVKGVSLANGFINNATASNSNIYVGYSIKDISPQTKNYNAEERNNPNLGVVYDCDDNNAVVTAPVNPLPLSGHGSERIRATSKQCVDKDSHITVSAIAMKDDSSNYVIFVEADLVSFVLTVDSGFTVSSIRNASVEYIKQELGINIKPTHINLSASHTHSAPSTSILGDDVKAYNAFVQRNINEAIKEAILDMDKATISYDKFEVYLDQNGNVVKNGNTISDANKRHLIFTRHYTTNNYFYSNGDIVYKDSVHGLYGIKCDAPNTNCATTYSSPVYVGHTRETDNNMQVIKISYSNSSKKPVLMVNWPNHPALQSGPDKTILTADWTGYFRNYLENKGYRVSYYNAAGGDVLPRTSLESEDIKIDGKSIVYAGNINTDAQAKFAASNYGEKLGELVEERLKSSTLFKNTVNPKNGIKYYQEENKTEQEANKQILYLRNWNDKDSNGNNVYNDTLLYNAYFIERINSVAEADILNGTDNFKKIINGEFTLADWKADWDYKDESGNDIPFAFPPYFAKNGVNNVQTVSEKLVSILVAHNSLYSNKFIFEQNKLTGYKNNTYPTKGGINLILSLIGEELDDLNTPTDERVYSRTHASVILGTRKRTAKYSNLELDAFSVGDFGFITAPYEMFSSSGKYIYENSPFNQTFILAYTNGRNAYLPDKATFDYGSYEADTTWYVAGTAEKNAETFVNRLNTLYDWSATDWYSSYTYTLSSNEITLTKYNGTEEIVYVPSTATINNKTYQTKISGEVFKDNRNIKYVQFEDGIKAATSLKDLFRDCANLIEVKFNNIDTTSVTDMSYMFFECYKLTSVDINKLNTSKVTNMHGMFTMCISLTELSLINFDTSKVTDMQSMFYGCSKLESLNLSSFNTVSVTNFISMFHGCTSLKSLNLGSFNTSNATNMYRMFYDCSNLESIYVGNLWNTSKVTSSAEMFGNASKIKGENGTVYNSTKIDKTYARIDKPGNPGYFSGLLANYTYTKDDTNKKITLTKYNGNEESIIVPAKIDGYDVIISGDVYNGNTIVKYVTFEDGVKAGTSLKNLFRGCKNLSEIKLNNFDTSDVIDMSYMFYECFNLEFLDISKLNTSKVTNMHGMFTSCSKLTELSLTNFDTSKVTDIQSMFYGCSKLVNLDLSSFDTSSMTNMVSPFYGCSSLTSLNLASFNTSKVTSMYRMFYGCSNLETITVSSLWNTSKVTNSTEMFMNVSKIKGEKGTTYDSTKIDKTYARIDASGTPGYFTFGEDQKTVLAINVPTSTYVVGKYMFTRNTNSNYDGKLTTKRIMLASKSITGNSESDMIIYYKKPNGEWIDALTGASITVPTSFAIKVTDLDKTLSIVGSTINTSQYASSNINSSTYVIGKHMFTRNTNSNYDGKLTTKRIMLASKSITSNSESDMIIYYKKPTGEWIDAILGTNLTAPSNFDIGVIDLVNQ